MTLGARKTRQQASDDIDLDPADFAEIDAAIDESDAQIAAGEPGISAEESIERLRGILFG